MSRIRRWGTVLLSVGLIVIIGACSADFTSSSDPVNPPDELLGLPIVSGFVKCTPQSYASSTVSIGPSGGVIYANGHRLTVPAGALDSTVSITMEAPSDTIRSVKFSPEGLTFNAEHRPTLRMDYSQCSILSLLSKRIVYTNEQWSILETLLSLDLFSLLKVEASLDHFSRYAVHY